MIKRLEVSIYPKLKPSKPIEPKKFLIKKERLLQVIQGTTLAQIQEFSKNLDPKKVYFEVVSYNQDRFDNYPLEYFISYDREYENPNYEKEYKEYLKEMSCFKSEMKEFITAEQDKINSLKKELENK